MITNNKKRKFQKQYKGRIKNLYETRANTIQSGLYAIKTLEKGKIPEKQIETIRRTLTNYTKRQIKIWIKINANNPITQKSTGVRMGKGKGKVKFWAANVNCGKILFEVHGKNTKTTYKALQKSLNKLSLKSQIVKKHELIF